MQMPDRVAFNLFGKDIYWYGVLMAMGIVVAVILAMREGKRKKLPEDTIIDLCLVMIPLGVVFARLYYVAFELDYYLKNPISILYVWEGGLAIYGAVIGGLLGVLIYARVKKLRFLRLVDCIAPGLVLAQAIGRWGNFFNQEAFDLPINNGELLWCPLAVKIEGMHYFDGMLCENPYHMATFFYESVWCLIIFIFLWTNRKKFKHDGDTFLTYALLYAFERMFIEGLRGDSLKIGDVRVSQILSAVMFAAVLIFFVVRHIKEKKTGRLIWPSPLVAQETAGEADASDNDASDKENEQDRLAADETDAAQSSDDKSADDEPAIGNDHDRSESGSENDEEK
jgi:phosphatidylglycerol:prolipoprotein diacylglycerol transferase